MVNIRLKEDETTEFKESWNDAGLETLAAFANTRGGMLYLGVDVRGDAVGITLTDRDLAAIVNQISSLGLTPHTGWQEHNGNKVLEIDINPSPVLVAYGGRYYTRAGNTTRLMTPVELGAKFLALHGPTWDNLPANVTRDTASHAAVSAFREAAGARIAAAPDTDDVTVLSNLNLVRDGRLSYAAVLLFTDNPQATLPGATVHVGRFVAGGIKNDATFGGHLWAQLERATEWFRGNLDIVERVIPRELTPEGFRRIEDWEYPEAALREAVLNALTHRDYTASGDIQIGAYDDRLEIWNPGVLPLGLTFDDLKRPGHPSKPRNPLIAQTFHFAGLVERWGTGTTRIIDACRQVGLPDPRFFEESGGFKVVFERDRYSADALRKLGVSERQLKAILEIKGKRIAAINNTLYQGLAGVSKRTATRDLEELVAKGILRKIGATGKGAKYSLVGP